MAAVQWVSLGYLLTVTAALSIAGRSAGTRGGRPLLVCGSVVVAIASAGCGLASALALVVAFRVAQAVGAAALLAGLSTVTSGSVAPERRRPVVRARAVARTLGLVTGPAAGGVLVGLWGWRSVFLVNVPLGLAGAVAGSCLLPRTRDRSAAGLGVRAHRRAERHAALVPAVTAGGVHLALFALVVLFAQVCAVRGVRPVVAGVVAAAPPAGFAAGALARRGSRHVRGLVATALCVAAMGCLALAPANLLVDGTLPATTGAALGALATAYGPATRRDVAAGGERRTIASGLGVALGVETATLCTHVTGPPDTGRSGTMPALAVLMLVVPAITALASFSRPRPPVPPADGGGTPPDARFLLANERTYLAWSRTALALVAAGLAIVQLLRPFPGSPWGRRLLGVLLIAVGAAVAAIGYLELQRNRRALHRNEPLPPSVLPKVLTLAVLSMAVVSAAVLVIAAAHGG